MIDLLFVAAIENIKEWLQSSVEPPYFFAQNVSKRNLFERKV